MAKSVDDDDEEFRLSENKHSLVMLFFVITFDHLPNNKLLKMQTED
jgi:hypothetical protein